MPEIGTSGLMSGDGKRGGAHALFSRPSSTLPASGARVFGGGVSWRALAYLRNGALSQ
jgi:hypothetical protein